MESPSFQSVKGNFTIRRLLGWMLIISRRGLWLQTYYVVISYHLLFYLFHTPTTFLHCTRDRPTWLFHTIPISVRSLGSYGCQAGLGPSACIVSSANHADWPTSIVPRRQHRCIRSRGQRSGPGWQQTRSRPETRDWPGEHRGSLSGTYELPARRSGRSQPENSTNRWRMTILRRTDHHVPLKTKIKLSKTCQNVFLYSSRFRAC